MTKKTKRMLAEKWVLEFEGFTLTAATLADAIGISRRYAKRLLDDFCKVGIITCSSENCVATSYLIRAGKTTNGSIIYRSSLGKDIPF